MIAFLRFLNKAISAIRYFCLHYAVVSPQFSFLLEWEEEPSTIVAAFSSSFNANKNAN
jgi:hypothetical protein